jgi:hypothetical protein
MYKHFMCYVEYYGLSNRIRLSVRVESAKHKEDEE